MTLTNAETLTAAFETYLDEFGADRLDELRRAYEPEGFLEVPNFAPPEVRAAVAQEVEHLLETAAQRRDVTVASTGNSPRRYAALGRDAIVEGSTVLSAIYRVPALLRFLAGVTGEDEVIHVPHEPEEMLVTRMSEPGDSHGWHWDDYPFAMIWLVEAPAAEDGGTVEFIPHTSWDKDDPRIDEHLAEYEIRRRNPRTGSIYLLKADTALHRIAPIEREGAVRTVLVWSFATPADRERQVSHESMADVYPEAYVA
jgi:hypothetical protein